MQLGYVVAELRLYGFQNTPGTILVRLKEHLATPLHTLFAPIVVEAGPLPIPPKAYEPKRDQYRAAPFLSALEPRVPATVHGLAFVNLDLFVPQLNFIFGVAQANGNALVALPRLRPSFYGLTDNPALYLQRVNKEAVHELGHVLGLDHCTNYCVMRFSNTLADTDEKPDAYCPTCRARLG
jgi:archaemetzincin